MLTMRQSLKAVSVGLAVDIGGSLIATFAVGAAALLTLTARSLSAHEINQQFWTPATHLFCSAGGLLMSLAGGYAAALIAGRRQLWHAAVVGVLSCVVGLVGAADLAAATGWPMAALWTAAVLPCALLGGYFATPACDQTI